MIGFASKWEVKSFWINGKFAYYVATKACDQVFDDDEIYKKCESDMVQFLPKILRQIKEMGAKSLKSIPPKQHLCLEN